ncbi:MAG: hypothetical protein AMXMBFR47_18270 [Planctomycetota bacterium]
MAEWNPRANEIFLRALELTRESARSRFLDQECGGNAALRDEVVQLLAANADAGDFLCSPPTVVVDAMERVKESGDRAAAVGSRVGPYRLMEQIGEGGFGTIFVAEQDQPVRRRVALKVIKPGMDSKQVIARFEAERQALAMMNHPNIARVIDAGTTDAGSAFGPGRPYFAMELVRGEPITQYCDSHRLPIRERLALFVEVCDAVQHAHSKGIIHRDLKATNVLVSRHDERPVVKVIDFGIAKAITGRLTDKTVYTEFHQLIGTPAYMSPEQAGFSDLDIDTRSDIYSLGVLLYELLTGTTPFDARTLVSAGYDEMRRIIREDEPPRPSTRAVSSGTSILAELQTTPGSRPKSEATLSRQRQRTSLSLARVLRGELDWIVMKCLEKDRSRRYVTANAVGMDVQRFLAGESVVAVPPSRSYRIRKFVRRNRAVVVAASLISISLAAGMAGTTFGLLRAEERRIEADDARRLAEKREKQTRKVSAFQASMLSGIDIEAMGRGIKERYREQVRAAFERQYVGEFPNRRKRTPEEIEAELAAFDERAEAAQAADVARRVMDEFVLARASDALEKKFADQPLVQAQLHDAIGNTYMELGLYDAAEPHIRAALEIRRRELGDEHPDIGPSLNDLAQALDAKGDYAAAEPMYRQALAALRRTPPGDEHRTVGPCLNSLGTLLDARGDPAAAEPLVREALAIARRAYGDEHEDVANCLNSLGVVLQSQGKHAAAEPLIRESLAMRRKLLGDEHPAVANSMNSLAIALMERREYAAAEALYTEALAIIRKAYGDEYSRVATLLANLATTFLRRNDYARAEPLYREALALRRKQLGDEHSDVALTQYLLAVSLKGKGDLEAAEPLLREALAMQRKALGDENQHVANTEYELAELLDRKGDHAAAEELFREALAMKRKLLGDEHPELANSLYRCARLLQDKGDFAAAEPLLREALSIHRKLLGNEHPDVVICLNDLACLLGLKGDEAAAAALFREALPLACERPGSDRALCALILHHLADSLLALQKLDEAEILARQAVEIYRAAADPSARGRREYCHAVDVLSQTLVDAGKPGEAILIEREFVDDLRRLVPPGDPSVATELAEFGLLLSEQKQYVEADSILREVVTIREQTSGRESKAFASALASLGLSLLAQDKYAEVEPLLRECLEIRQKALRPDSPDYWFLANTRSMLGGALVGQGAALIESNAPAAIAKFIEAEPLLVEAGEWLTQNSDRIPEEFRAKRIRQALERIVRLYESWHATDPDKGHDGKAAEWRAKMQAPAPDKADGG